VFGILSRLFCKNCDKFITATVRVSVSFYRAEILNIFYNVLLKAFSQGCFEFTSSGVELIIVLVGVHTKLDANAPE
jgi:hypothetical protein